MPSIPGVGMRGQVGGPADASAIGDAGWDFGPPDDAGFTACTYRTYQICGYATPCPSSVAGCEECVGAGGGVGVCDATFSQLDAQYCDEWCDDGQVCLMQLALCVPYPVGYLLERYTSEPPIVALADFSSWSNQPVPSPATCPAFSSFVPCGGPCGYCASGLKCAGRSPLHPFGLCVPYKPDFECSLQTTCPSPTDGCFIFSVDTAGQSAANVFGRCMPLDECQQIATEYPGGALCIGP